MVVPSPPYGKTLALTPRVAMYHLSLLLNSIVISWLNQTPHWLLLRPIARFAKHSLGKLGLRPSYANEICVFIMFLHKIQGNYVNQFNQLMNHLDVLWDWLICKQAGHVSCYRPIVMMLMIIIA